MQKKLTLEAVYKDFDNEAKIISFQGANDNLIDYTIKRKLINQVSNAEFLLIGEKEVDGHIFKSNRHGLDADFLKMFELGLSKLGKHVNENECKEKYSLVLSNTKKWIIHKAYRFSVQRNYNQRKCSPWI